MENGLEEYFKTTRQRSCTIVVLFPVPTKHQSPEAINDNNNTPTQTTLEINARTHPENWRHQILPDREPQRLQQGKETQRKQEQQKAQHAIAHKQHKDRERFQQQAKVESTVKHNTPKNMTSADKLLRLEKE